MRPVGTPRTTRLRKLECNCGNIAYQSRARLSAGLLRCCCGLDLIPADPDDAALVLPPERLETHPAVQKYAQCVADALHGQTPHLKRLTNTGRALPKTTDARAMETFEEWRRENATAIRLNALRAHTPRRESDPIPF